MELGTPLALKFGAILSRRLELQKRSLSHMTVDLSVQLQENCDCIARAIQTVWEHFRSQTENGGFYLPHYLQADCVRSRRWLGSVASNIAAIKRQKRSKKSREWF